MSYLVSDFQLKLEFVHSAYPQASKDDLGLEVSLVILIIDEVLHLLAQSLNILERCVKRDIDINSFQHAFATSNVVDPKRVENIIRDLVMSDRQGLSSKAILTWITSRSVILLNAVYRSDICSTSKRLIPSGPYISTRSPISYGCFTNKNLFGNLENIILMLGNLHAGAEKFLCCDREYEGERD
jgi:hypothetical protein